VAEVRLDRPERAALLADAVRGVQRGVLDRVADRGARAVRLDEADAGRIDTRTSEYLLLQQPLSFLRRAGHRVRGSSMVVDAGAAQDGQHAVAVGEGVGQALQRHHAAPLAGHDAVGVGGERPAPPRGRQHAHRRGREGALRGEVERDAPGERQIDFARAEGLAAEMDRDQGGGAGAVERHRGSTQPEEVADAAGGRRPCGADHAVGVPAARLVAVGQGEVVVVRVAGEHPGRRAAQAVGAQAGVLQRLARRLQEQPRLRVDPFGLVLGQPEERRLEPAHVVDETAPAGGELSRHAGFGVVEGVGVPPIRRDLGHQITAFDECLPQRIGGVHAAGKTAAYADDGDGRFNDGPGNGGGSIVRTWVVHV
jgi:hypothetical protein